MKTKVSVSRVSGSRAIIFSVILAALFLLPVNSMAGVLLNSDLLVTHANGQPTVSIPSDQAQPSIAYDPLNNKYLTVWTDYRNVTSAKCGAQGCGTDIYGVICAGSTWQTGDSFTLQAPTGLTISAVSITGLVLNTDYSLTATGYQTITITLLTGSAAVNTTTPLSVTLTYSDASTGTFNPQPPVMSCGDSFLISTPDTTNPEPGNQSQAKVAFYPDPKTVGNSRYLVVWTDSTSGSYGQIYGQFVKANGKLVTRLGANGADNFPISVHIPSPAPNDNGTASGGTSTTLSDATKSWTVNEWAGLPVTITGGTGAGQTNTVYSNTATTLTVSSPWTIIPDNTSQYSLYGVSYIDQSNPDLIYDEVTNKFVSAWLDISNWDISTNLNNAIYWQGMECVNPITIYYLPLGSGGGDNNLIRTAEVSPVSGAIANFMAASGVTITEDDDTGKALNVYFNAQHDESSPRVTYSPINGAYYPAWSGRNVGVTLNVTYQNAPICSYSVQWTGGVTDLQHGLTTDTTAKVKLRRDDGLNLVHDFSFGNTAVSPALAVDPSTNLVLVAWEEQSNPLNLTGGKDILGQLVDLTNFLNYGSTINISTATNDQTSPAVAYDNVNQRFLATWEDARNQSANISNIDIYGQFIDPQGNLSGANIPITTAPANQIEPAVAFGDVDFRKFFVIWSDGRDPSQADIYGQLLEYSQQSQLLVQASTCSGSGTFCSTDADCAISNPGGGETCGAPVPVLNGALNFGNVPVSQPVTTINGHMQICNQGNAQLTINSMSLPDTPFSFATPIPQTISPGPGGTSCYDMNVEFTPTAAGSYSGNPNNNFRTAILSDGGNLILYFSGNGVGVQPLTITTASLPSGSLNKQYGVNLTAVGGVYPYTWSVPGDSGTATGGTSTTLSDTSKSWTVNQWKGLPVTIISGAGAGDTRTIASNTATTLTVATAWTTTPDATSKYTINLPAGLSLQTSGTCPTPTGTLTCSSNMPCICGTPTTADTFPVTVTVTDNNTPQSFQSKTFSLSVSSITVSPASLDPWTQGQPGYNQPLTASGGTVTTGYIWSIVGQTAGTNGCAAGDYPINATNTGLCLTASGVLISSSANANNTDYGPLTSGTFTFTVQVQDNASPQNTAKVAYSVTIYPALAILTTSLPNGVVGTAYSQAIVSTGGTPPVTWAVTYGALPAGLTLNSGNGVISGTPTSPTTNPTPSFTVTATDKVGASSTDDSGKATGAGASTLTDSNKSWTATEWDGLTVTITSGTGAGQTATIVSNTATELTVSPNWSTVPDTTSTYAIIGKRLTIVINSGLDISNPTSGAGSPPGASMGIPYSYTFTAAGGTAPYTWSVLTSSLPTGLTLDPNTGVLSGTPAALGTFTFIVQVKDINNTTVTKTFSITVFNLPPALNNPVWTVGVPYNDTTLSSATGQGPYTWAITSGNLPAGLTLSSNGVISGTPTTAGTYNFTATATNSVTNASSSMPFTLLINPVLSITTAAVDTGTVNEDYNQQLNLTGGTAPYTWSIVSGSLPQFVTLDAATGAIGSGINMLQAAGSFTFTVQVTDATYATAPTTGKNVATKTYTLTVGSISITPDSLSSGSVGAAYSQPLTATGGTPLYTWSSGGSLPPGLTIDPASGVISGTPTTAGTYTFIIKATDSQMGFASKTYTVTIYGPPVITTQALSNPAWTTGVAYSDTSLAATGGQPLYKWTIGSGNLPTGLNINVGTGAINGTPTAIGTFNFTVKITDATGSSASKPFTIVINPPLNITTPLLGSGSIFAAYNQLVGINGGTGPYLWSISSGLLPPGLFINATTGAISGTPTAVGTYTFTVQVTDSTYSVAATSTNIATRSYTVTIGTQLALNPISLDFGSQLVGSTTSLVVTVTNGGAGNLTITGVSTPADTDFIISDNTCASAALATGQTCLITVSFLPADGGDFASSFTITSSDPANPSVVVPLSGVGISSAINLPTQIDFGQVLIGSTSAPYTVTVKDTSLAPLALSSLIYPGTPFTIISDTCQPRPKTITGGGTCAVTMVFNPTAKRMYSKYLTFMSNDPTTPVARVLITGQGIAKTPEISLSADSVDFGGVAVGTSARQTVTVSNEGTGNLIFSSIIYPGGVFKVVSDTCTGSTLKPMASCSVVLKFKPVAVKQYAPHYLTIKTNDPVQPKVRVTLNGTGT